MSIPACHTLSVSHLETADSHSPIHMTLCKNVVHYLFFFFLFSFETLDFELPSRSIVTVPFIVLLTYIITPCVCVICNILCRSVSLLRLFSLIDKNG